MIAWLEGEVLEASLGSLILKVGGVGYGIQVAPKNRLKRGDKAALFIHTAVREDAITLFGFEDRAALDVFLALIGVPGIGPAKAIGMLASPVADLADMVQKKDLARLAKLPGIGKKTAERIVLDLHDKLAGLVPQSRLGSAPPALGGGVKADAISALVNLGLKPQQAEEKVKAALKALGPTAGVAELVKEALQPPQKS